MKKYYTKKEKIILPPLSNQSPLKDYTFIVLLFGMKRTKVIVQSNDLRTAWTYAMAEAFNNIEQVKKIELHSVT